MELDEIAADDQAAVDTYVALSAACVAADCPWEVPPTRYRQLQEMQFGWDGELARYFLIREDDAAVGTVCFYAPEHENLDLVWIELRIAPDLRRQGRGRAAWDLVTTLTRSVGRSSVILEGGWDSAATHAFAAALDLPLAQVTVRRVHELTGSPDQRALLADLAAEAAEHAAGYDLVRIEGRTPEHLVDGVVAATAAINDAPLDDLDYEDEVYDADRIRTFEQAQEDAGFRLRRVLAVERATGAAAGHTVLSVYSEQPAYAEQEDTTVVREHRGNRLGLALKADMALWLLADEPQLRWVLTENAESNDAMIGVNERLGYRVAGRQLLFQRRVD